MRKKLNFDKGWIYHKEVPGETAASDRYGAMYVSAKTERIKSGPGAYKHFDYACSWSFDDEIPNEVWEDVNLPHDYIIRQTPKPENGSAPGFFEYHNAWYRKHFSIGEENRGKRISLLFDGVSGNSTVYLNGCLITHNHCAYTPFEADISDYVFFDKENVVAVYIDMSLIEGWWYRGAGIYRHCNMIISDKVCVDLFGNYVYPSPRENKGEWNVPVLTTVRNDSYEDAKITLLHHIIDKDGKECLTFTANGTVPSRDKKDLSVMGKINSPELWDIDSPTVYQLYTEVIKDGEVIDQHLDNFGFRTAYFDKDKGFFLNGKNVKIKGVCTHQDFGLTGLAVPDNIHEYKAKLLREMGANGFRTAHYPHSPEMMDALDRNGFLVLDEVRHFDSNEDSMKQVELTVKRDRNHPSVIFWSSGNEELRYHTLEQGANIQRALAAQIRKFDFQRPVTSAVAFPDQCTTVLPYMDIIGINYCLHLFEQTRALFPDKSFVSTENCAIQSSYGSYFGSHKELALADARDKDKDEKHPSRANTWKFISERDWVAGGYQWAGVEHRGEAEWPRLCSISGALDLFLQRKDPFWQNRSLWSDEPMVYILPHWNHPGLEGRNINVWVYTNCDEVELFLNGESLGKKTVERFGHGEWDVTYTPGEIKAIGYRDGKEAAKYMHCTAGKAYALALKEDTAPVHADSNEAALFTCTVTDECGRVIPNAESFVRFEADNGAEIVATGSANFDHVPPHITERRMYAGRITVAVRPKNAGKVTLYAYSDGLRTAVLDFEVLEKREECEVAYTVGSKINAGHV